jgi:NADH:ubiquinone oxidoreductase subunit C
MYGVFFSGHPDLYVLYLDLGKATDHPIGVAFSLTTVCPFNISTHL